MTAPYATVIQFPDRPFGRARSRLAALGDEGASEVDIIPTPPPRYDVFGLVVAMAGVTLTGLALWGFLNTWSK